MKRSRPLDFVVLADHSDGMGFFTMLQEGDPAMMGEELGRRWHRMIQADGAEAVAATLEVINKFSQGEVPWATNDPKLMRPAWDNVVEAAHTFRFARGIVPPDGVVEHAYPIPADPALLGAQAYLQAVTGPQLASGTGHLTNRDIVSVLE